MSFKGKLTSELVIIAGLTCIIGAPKVGGIDLKRHEERIVASQKGFDNYNPNKILCGSLLAVGISTGLAGIGLYSRNEKRS